jgi:L-ascorbate 6-phosphate lactonase
MRLAAGPLAQLAKLDVANGRIGLLWLGQSGFALRMNGATVLVDPFLSAHPDRRVPPVVPPDEAHGVDVIACTHEHWDHLDPDSLPALCSASPQARVVVPEPIVEMVTRLGIAPERVLGMQPDRSAREAGISIHAIPACHGVHPADAYTFGRELSGGLYRFLGYVFEGGGVSVYHAGDTILYEDLALRLRQRKVDVCLVPINGRDREREARDIVGNLDSADAAALAIEAGADVVVPMHYDMFAANPGHPGQLVAAVQRTDGRLNVVVPAHGCPFVYTRPGGRP